MIPAGVVAGVSLQRPGSTRQSHTSKRVKVAEHGVRQAGEAIGLLLEDVLPVRLEAWGVRGVRSK